MSEPGRPTADVQSRLLSGVAVLASLALLMVVSWVAARPLSTPDLWFHLKAGETYFSEGLWPGRDPMLFTGLSTGPVQHEWLFGVFAHLGEQAFGLQGLRVLHLLMVLGVLWLVAILTRRASGGAGGMAVGLAAFAVLAWPRLVQFRPDLWTIAATCTLQLLVLAPRAGPSRPVLGAALLIQLLWSNAHSLAAIGIALVAAALLGAAFERGILEQIEAEGDAEADGARARAGARVGTLAWAVGLLLVVGFVHPRGADQLLTFFISTSDTAIWEIHDEWSAFNPLSHAGNAGPVSFLSWLLTDAIFLGFGALVVVRFRALQSGPTRAQLRALDPPAFIVAAAACGAMLISVRFLWMGIFPVLYLCTALPALAARMPRLAAAVPAVLALALLGMLPGPGGLSAYASDVPSDAREYLGTPVNRSRFAHESAQFLRDTGAEGRLFNPYELGAYYGYHLAPRLRTFIDSRTEHYGAEVFQEWSTITFRRVHEDGRDFLQLLEDRKVDFFFGVGPPGYGYSLPYTLANLDGQPGWLRVYRNAGQVVYLRKTARNRDNLARITAHYATLGVPFDAEHGLDVAAVLQRRLPWAVEQRLVPAEFAALRAQGEAGSRGERARARIKTADMRFVAGDYRGAARDATEAMELGARGARPAEVVVGALQRAGDLPAAQAFLQGLAANYGSEPWAQQFLQRFTRR